MGWFSSVCSAVSSAVSSVCSAVSSCCSAVGSAISGAISSVGGALSSFASSVAPSLGAIFAAGSTLAKMHPAIAGVLAVAGALALANKIFGPNDKPYDPKEMGERVLQGAEEGIKPENYEDFNDYIQALRDLKLDPEKVGKYTEATSTVAGLGVLNVALEKRLNLPEGTLNQIWLLPAANPEYFTKERVTDMVSTGFQGTDKIGSLIEGKLSGDEASELRKEMSTAVGKGHALTPEERAEFNKAIAEARAKWAELDAEIKKADASLEPQNEAPAPNSMSQA